MRRTTNRLEHRLARRALSVCLAAALVLGLLPLWAVPARADGGSVTYSRKAPEVAILNRYTGTDRTLYNQLKGTDTQYPQYNAIGLFDGLSYGSQVKNDATHSWSGFGGSQLRELSKPSGNLETNLSATLYNRKHTHQHAKKLSLYDYNITLWETVRLQMGSGYPTRVTGFNDEYMQEYPRVGDFDGSDNSYGPVRYDANNADAILHFSSKTIDYDHFGDLKHCTCRGTYAENMLLTFRDTRAPIITGVYYSTDDGKNYTNRHSGFRVSGGKTLFIKVSFDEPIRFADDSASGKENLYLELKQEGASTGSDRKAYLQKLEGNDLIFTYEFQEKDKELSITELDTASLFGKDLPLKQVKGTESFSLDSSLTGNDGKTGFSTTTCYITDLAGNALTKTSIGKANLTLDSQAPYVEKVEFQLSLNNADVKEALGKTDPKDKDYTDASDLYLGVGDSITLSLQMNERVKGIAMTEINQGTIIDWKHAVATTNIKNEKGEYVTAKSQYFTPYNRITSGNTVFIMQPIPVREGWRVDDPNGEIKVTEFKLIQPANNDRGTMEAEVTDQAGNALDKSSIKIKDGANSNPPRLDVTAPTVKENGGYAAEDNGFRYGVSIADDTSSYAGIYGSFVLNNGGDGKAYQYEWAVTAAADTAVTEWQTGVTGTEQRFIQTQDSYIHIRPLESETYGDLSSCTLTVKAKDYAGNESSIILPSEDGKLSWYIDNLAPTARAGEVTRALNSDGTGTLTAEVILTDSTGISAWQYAWGDSDTQAPGTWTDGSVTATSNADPVTVTATGTAEASRLFSQYLWIKATDNSGGENTSEPICLGQYTYDLRGAQYALKYSNGITRTASLEVESLGDNDTLFFLAKVQDKDEYFMWFSHGGESNKHTTQGNLFDVSKSWYGPYTLAEEGGIYTLTKVSDSAASFPTVGNLSVTVLSGPKSAMGSQDDVWTIGNAEYTFSSDTITLKVAGTDQDNYEGIRLSSDSDLGAAPNHDKYRATNGNYRTSLEGLQFTISIDKDTNGWNYADVDWAKSYVELKDSVIGSSTSYQFYLHQGQTASDGKTTQTLTIPAGDYQTGIYTATLHLACFAGQSYERTLTKEDSASLITVDTVEPNSSFVLSELSYVPDHEGYGIKDYCGTLDLMTDEVIKLPMAQNGNSKANTSFIYPFTIISGDEAAVTILERNGAGGRFGQYALRVWNSADPDNVLEIAPEGKVSETEQTTVKNVENGGNCYGFVFDESAANRSNLYLKPGESNNISMQKVYSNGRTSDIRTVQIEPVQDFVTGTVSVDSGTKELVFTPTEGVSTVGAKAYAWAWQNGQDPQEGAGERIDMAPTADGTWRCDLLENGAQYAVVTVSADGCIWNTDDVTVRGSVRERAPWFDRLKTIHGGEVDPGMEGLNFIDNGDGTYKLSFCVRDDYNTIQNGLKLDIGFNEAYSADHLNLNLKDSYIWTETGVSTTGISSVTVEKGKFENYGIDYYLDYLDVTVEGSYVPNRSEGKTITDEQPMQITVTATDALGNRTAISTEEKTVAYQTPKITSDSLGGKGLTLTFNQPVRPMDSWAWHDADSDVKGLQKQWDGAFPIAGNGTYDLQFTDIFGTQCTQELTTTAFTKDGKDYSIDLDFADPDSDGKSCLLTATSQNGYLTFWDKGTHNAIWSGEGYETIRASDGTGSLAGITWDKSRNGGTVHVGNVYRPAEEVFKNNGVHERSIYWQTTGDMSIRCGKVDGTILFKLDIYIDNVVSAAPVADVRYYVYGLGEEFDQERLEQYITDNGGSVTVTGNVQVWYKTTRSVTPTAGGKEYLLTPENYKDGHTFDYEDALGNKASVHVTLPEGLTLQAPATPPEDNNAPNVDIDIYTKRSGSYSQADAFLPEDTNINQKFADLGYVQGYSLTVNASDASGFDIAVTGDGATLDGNVITITKAGTFTIAVTDRSKNQNKTEVTFTVPSKIDNTAPVGTIAVSATSLYEKDMILTVTDKDDQGNDTVNGEEDTVMLSLPTNATRTGKNTFQYHVANNGEVEFVFFDLAGNRGTIAKTVSGIDTEPPAFTVRWSPSENETDSQYAPVGPVNSNVIARISSNKAMSKLTVRAENETDEHQLLVNGAAQSYSILGQDNKPLVTFDATPEQVIVTYTGNYEQPLIFSAGSANGKSSTLTLDGVSAIDKTAPGIDVEKTDQIRTNYTVPYAVKVKLTPNENVTSPNYGDKQIDPMTGTTEPVWYNDSNPLELTFTDNGTYNVRFADEAGNVTTQKVEITGIDRTAPVLTVAKTEENNTVKVTVTADEACTVAAEDKTYSVKANTATQLTFTKNGTYEITATDAAGNTSAKMVSVGSIDDVAPTISFTNSTIYVMQGTSEEALQKELDRGYTALDNVKAEGYPTVSIDKTEVKLDTAGQYTVTYTVTDKAGNKAEANRFVRVIGTGTVCPEIDGALILPVSTAVLRPGEHTLTLRNCDEPYSVKARKGILSEGQMKYLSGSSLRFDANGNFLVTDTGYYTLLVTTQSRQTIHILLYVER